MDSFKVGQVVKFQRGMFGAWEGRIVKLYAGRAWPFQGKPCALVSFTRKNGKRGTRRVAVEFLAPVATDAAARAADIYRRSEIGPVTDTEARELWAYECNKTA